MQNILDLIIKLGGTGKMMEPEIVRTTFTNVKVHFNENKKAVCGKRNITFYYDNE